MMFPKFAETWRKFLCSGDVGFEGEGQGGFCIAVIKLKAYKIHHHCKIREI